MSIAPGSSEADVIRWAEAALAARTPSGSIQRYERASSRVSALYRLFVQTPTGQGRLYLKVFDPQLTPTAAISDLRTVSEAFGISGDLAFVKVIAADPRAGVVLFDEAEGIPLPSFRNRSLSRLRISGMIEVWHRAGQWLRRLHWETQFSRVDPDVGSRTASYIHERLRRWANLDPHNAALAQRVGTITDRIALDVGAASMLVPCHGDISPGNIMVGSAVTFIDFDDFRFDLPALDLSQAIMEIREYGRLASMLPLPPIGMLAERRFREGYGTDRWPTGAAWLLPHISNLAVYLVTMAPKRTSFGWRSRYRRTRRELIRTVAGH